MALRKFVSREIGENIKRIRRALEMSQEEFGKAAGDYSQDTVVKWEAGQVPHALILVEIARLADCSVDSILNREPVKDTVNGLVMKIKRDAHRLGEINHKKAGHGKHKK